MSCRKGFSSKSQDHINVLYGITLPVTNVKYHVEEKIAVVVKLIYQGFSLVNNVSSSDMIFPYCMETALSCELHGT